MSSSPNIASSFAMRWVSGAMLLVIVAGSWVWRYQHTYQEILELGSGERQALYQRTIETLRTVCSHPKGLEILDFCREQASFIVRFPECDGQCRDAARRLEPKPTK